MYKHFVNPENMLLTSIINQTVQVFFFFKGSGPANPLKIDDFQEKICDITGMNSHNAPLVNSLRTLHLLTATLTPCNT